MRPLRYSINVTVDGCCDRRKVPDEDLHRHAAENIDRADALLFGRVTYEMMEAAWRPPVETGARPEWMESWMEPFARTIDAAKKYVVSSTLDRGWIGTRSSSPAIWGRCSTAQAGVGQCAAQASGPWADVVRWAIEACRPEARGPAGVRVRGGGDAV
jgi:hypothetical protein